MLPVSSILPLYATSTEMFLLPENIGYESYDQIFVKAIWKPAWLEPKFKKMNIYK